MKVQATRQNLVKLLSECATVARPKSPHPMFSCCLLETDGGGLRGAATDSYRSITSSAQCVEISAAGGVAVSAKDLLERVKTLPEGPVTLQRDEAKLRVSAGKRKHVLQAFPPEEFPPVSRKLTGGMRVPGKTLVDLFRRTKPMAAIDSDRAQIKSVLLEFENGRIAATSTDGHRLSFCNEAVDGCKAGAAPLIVPIEAVDMLTGLLDPELDAELGMVGQELAFSFGPITFSTKLVEGFYPPIRQHFSAEPAHASVVGRKAFLESVASVEKAADMTSNLVEVTLTTGLLSLKAEGKGGATDEVEAKYEGAEVRVGSNARYLIEALNAIDSDDVRFGFGSELEAIWLRPAEGDAVLEVIMPARLKDG